MNVWRGCVAGDAPTARWKKTWRCHNGHVRSTEALALRYVVSVHCHCGADMYVPPYFWRWSTMQDPNKPSGVRCRHPFANRVGQPLRVVAEGNLNSLLIEFEDGTRAVCSRNAIGNILVDVPIPSLF